MRLSNIFELSSLTPSPETGMNPAPKPGSAAAAAGANTIRGVTGQSGSAVAKALGTLGQGKTLTPGLAKALDPYADALTKILSDPQLRTKFVQLMKQTQKQESVTEDQDSVDAVAGAITRRIMMQHTDLLSKYGPVKVMAAIDDVAEFAGGDGLDEIGSSDVSIWTKQVVQDLEAGHYDRMQEDEQIDELEKKTLGSYVKKASGAEKPKNVMDPKNVPLTNIAAYQGDSETGHFGSRFNQATYDKAERLRKNRETGIKRAVDKLTKEEVEGDEVDTVTMDVPLLLRVLEFAREEVQEDMDLHDLAERMIAMSKDGPLSMDDYDSIVGSVEALPAPDKVGEDSGKSKQYIEIVSVLGHTKRVPVHPLNAYKALNHYRDQPSTKSARIVSEEQPMDEVSNKTLSSYTDKAAKERDTYHADRNKDAESARKYFNRKAGVRKALSVTKENYYTPGPETMPGAVGPQETTTVSFNQSKQMGDATLNINASAKDMEELHRILKLAGIDYASDSGEQEPNMQDVAVALEPHAPEAPAEEPCGCEDEEPADVKYSTDKQTLINVLRDKLQKRLA